MPTTIYAYSMPSHYEDRIAAGKKPWIKVGMTRLAADDRIDDQDRTANPEPPVKLDEWVIYDGNDKAIHKILTGTLGAYRIREEREWFECSLEDVRKSLNFHVHGVQHLPQSFH